jgi:DNA-binding transcriptional ArsR family regulator
MKAEKILNAERLLAQAQTAASFLSSLANPVRLLVLCHLAQEERCVQDLERCIGISQSALSQHLARLRAEGLVGFRRDGQQLYYRIIDENVMKILQVLYEMYCVQDNH